MQTPSSPYIPQIRLEQLDPAQAPDLTQFYQMMNEPDLLPRPEDEFRAAAESGLMFVVLDGAAIVAAAGVFDVQDGYVELGATGVVARFRGYQLQQLLARVRVAAVVAHQGKTIEQTTAIKPANVASNKSMASIGFTPWANPISAMTAPCAGCVTPPGPGRTCCCDFLHLPAAAKHQRVEELLSEVAHRGAIFTRTNKQTQHVIHIAVNTVIVEGAHRRDLEEYVQAGP